MPRARRRLAAVARRAAQVARDAPGAQLPVPHPRGGAAGGGQRGGGGNVDLCGEGIGEGGFRNAMLCGEDYG
eukprot:7048561-Prymnesium_polylepis.1